MAKFTVLPKEKYDEIYNRASEDCISRQAAIDAYGEWYVEEGTENGFIGTVKQLLEGLPPAQPEPCEDAVSRKAVQYLLAHFVNEDKYNDACDGLKHLPSVTPKQRMGKWIKLDMHRGMADHKCTACEQECYVPTCMGEPMYAFCPNCGARMER